MKAFNKIQSGLDVSKARQELSDNSHLFGQFNARKDAGPVHAQMDDIWLRYGDISKLDGHMSDEHDSIWLVDLPECKKLCFEVMALVDGERLGGVLITKLPAGGEILPHSDNGWHAEYYDKYYIPIENEKGSEFCFESGVINPDIGDVWAFNNSYTHWVNNHSNSDRTAIIVCIKQNKYTKEGSLCLGE